MGVESGGPGQHPGPLVGFYRSDPVRSGPIRSDPDVPIMDSS
jgi:hypothetical protein